MQLHHEETYSQFGHSIHISPLPSPPLPSPSLGADKSTGQRGYGSRDFPYVTSALVKGALGVYSAFPALAVSVDDVTLAEMTRISRSEARV